MPRTLLFRGRADRVIGWARIILAASSIAAVSLDPLLSGSRSTLTTGIVGTYFLFAVIARILSGVGFATRVGTALAATRWISP